MERQEEAEYVAEVILGLLAAGPLTTAEVSMLLQRERWRARGSLEALSARGRVTGRETPGGGSWTWALA